MRKSRFAISATLALVLSVGMAGCASQSGTEEESSGFALHAINQTVNDSAKQSKDRADSLSEEASAKKAEAEELRRAEEEAKKQFSVGDLVTDANWNVTLERADLGDTVEPLNVQPNSTVMYLEASEGTTLVSFVFSVEALQNNVGSIMGNAIGEDYELKYGEYSYTSAQIQFYSGTGLWLYVLNYTLDPKMPEYVYITFAIPEEAKSDEKPIVLELEIAGQEKVITVR